MAKLALIGAALNLAGSIGATCWLGPVGPAVGSLPVVLVIDFVILPGVVCRHLDIPLRRYVRTALAPVLPTAAVAGIAALALIHLHPAHSALAAVVGASCWWWGRRGSPWWRWSPAWSPNSDGPPGADPPEPTPGP